MRSYHTKTKLKYRDMSYESKYLLDTKFMAKRDLEKYYRYFNKTNSHSQLKKIVILVLCICVFLYIFVDYSLRNHLPHVQLDYNVSKAYFVNTPGCQMPYFDVTNDDIMQYIFKRSNYICKKPLTRTSDEGSELWLNMNEQELLEYFNISNIENTICEYTEIKRKNDFKNQYLKQVEFKLEFNKSVHISPGIEFIRVECYNEEGKSFYKDFHFFIIKDKIMPKYDKTEFKTEQHKDILNNNIKSHHLDERVSVMVIGIDSVSHLNFLRQMRKTAEYIRHKLTHVEFWGYNKVGDNTYPNLIPLLTGLDRNELNFSCLAPVKHANYDSCTLIWSRFKNMDFKTVFAEDVARLGLFHFNNPGFKKQPTDYYLRPIVIEMEDHINYLKSLTVDMCLGGRHTADVLLEMIKKLVPLLKFQDFFSFFWTLALTHDELNIPSHFDDDILTLFKKFESEKIFNKTVIFLMSDHGFRWGSFRNTYQGMIEERQPLIIALYPPNFKSKYPKAIKNLEQNAYRLTTPFDVYETLLDLLHISNLEDKHIFRRESEMSEMETLPRGISLFLPIPETRTCENADIAAHWCTCHQKQELATNDVRVQRAARYIVMLINERLKPYSRCRNLYLNSILEANMAAPYHKIVKNIKNDYSSDITLRLQTKPGLALFESTVRMTSYSIVLTGTISRLNVYISQSYCVKDSAIKMFCYCHR